MLGVVPLPNLLGVWTWKLLPDVKLQDAKSAKNLDNSSSLYIMGLQVQNRSYGSFLEM